MTLTFSRHTHVSVHKNRVVARRDFVRGVTATAIGAPCLALADGMSLRAEELRKRGMACILLWMQGGPSQFELFDPKPGHSNGGDTKAIATSIAGVRIADSLPQLARSLDRLALIRSMTTKEGNHQRASYLLHTSYAPTASVNYPTLGSAVSHQVRDAACELPAFVRIGRRFANGGGGGILGTEFDPFNVDAAGRPPANTRPSTDLARFHDRLSLLDRLEGAASVPSLASVTSDQRRLYQKASRMITSDDMRAFDLSQEDAATRDAYGQSEFATDCLLARRLVESRVTFVEVSLGNWDTHDNNFERSRQLATQLDQPFAALLADLARRGLLDTTLVVWMGEFGRTPRINPRGGRDHFPKAFSVGLAGAGIRANQVIGSTDRGGDEIADRPVTVNDLFRTIYRALGIDADHENSSSIGRPIKLVDGGQVVDELLA